MNATFTQRDGRPAVRLERTLPYTAERVWRALTVPDESARWFPSTLTIEPRVGGTVTFAGDPNTPDSAGTVLAFTPLQLVAFSWGSNVLRFDLTAINSSECVLTLVDTLTAENEAARNAAGWDVCLAQLDVHLAGHESDGPHGASASSWQERYEHYVELGLPSGAMIPGTS
ncbi:SRPBCC family protein [Cryobacterium sp. PH31-L1]|uniref:SRPBCC family protein n=1 Tax=Cryobacterium sp. PH31-L1 TaxID=3046199 RepID=UPI0024B92B5B|nr:SRPBCC family protein [Cryobacterium sp. PH31-L1]MDJ0377800.1 SRPBCC family protein [Cryobacterium sp. PH31-L1]